MRMTTPAHGVEARLHESLVRRDQLAAQLNSQGQVQAVVHGALGLVGQVEGGRQQRPVGVPMKRKAGNLETKCVRLGAGQ